VTVGEIILEERKLRRPHSNSLDGRLVRKM